MATDTQTEEPTDTPVDALADTDPTQDPNVPGPEDTPTDEADTESTETPDASDAAADTAQAEDTEEDAADSAEEPSDELDDETIEALAEAYGERLRKTKTLSKTVSQQVKDEVQRQVREHQSIASTQTRADQFVTRGRAAAENIQQLAKTARGELAKVGTDEVPNVNVLKAEDIQTSLEEYGSATAMYERHILETATQVGFDHVFAEVLPELSDDQVAELESITTVVNRMRGDRQQFARADAEWMSRLLDFVAHRAMEHGATEERQRLASRSAIKGKIANKNAITAARAKLEAGKAPPRAPKSDPKQLVTEFSENGYREIKKTGTPEQIQEYVNRWATRAPRTSGRRA